MSSNDAQAGGRKCKSCAGTGSVGSEVGPLDCPDCGGSGCLPHPSVLVEWRARDIERARGLGTDAVAMDVRWLVSELRRARTALTEIAGVAADMDDSDAVRQIRFTAARALELFEMQPADASQQRH